MKNYIRFDIYSTWTISKHYMEDRQDRHCDIIFDTNGLGYGNYIVLAVERNDGKVEYLTNTGILLVVDLSSNEMKTAYPPRMDKVFAMYNNCGIEKVPHWMTEKVAMWEGVRKREEERARQNDKLIRMKEFEEYKKNRYKRG